MLKKHLRSWKKVFETDLPHISFELKEIVERPALFILAGKMGAGKTTFSKAFVEGETLSPTYSVLSETNRYLHADFYRIKTREEILHLELPLYLEDKDYLLVEWGEAFYSNLISEIPEDFDHYLLEIKINEGSSDTPSRDFELFSISEE